MKRWHWALPLSSTRSKAGARNPHRDRHRPATEHKPNLTANRSSAVHQNMDQTNSRADQGRRRKIRYHKPPPIQNHKTRARSRVTYQKPNVPAHQNDRDRINNKRQIIRKRRMRGELAQEVHRTLRQSKHGAAAPKTAPPPVLLPQCCQIDSPRNTAPVSQTIRRGGQEFFIPYSAALGNSCPRTDNG